MSSAVTNFRLFGAETVSAVSPYALQFMELKITGANTNTTWDLATSGGTFWTAAKANGTYGTIATKALSALQKCATDSYAFFQAYAGFIGTRPRAATALLTAYSQSVTSGIPTFAFAATTAPTADSLFIVWIMQPGAVVQNVPFA
jgi:hypothetical protein